MAKTALIALVACLVTNAGNVGDWVHPGDDPSVTVQPNRDQALDPSRVQVVPISRQVEAIRRLDAAEAIEVTEGEAKVLVGDGASIEAEGSYYLIRAVSGENEGGKFLVFQSGDSILSIYGVFGTCGEIRRSALIVRSTTPIAHVYGRCSAAL